MRLIDADALVEYFEGLARSLANARCFNAADAIQGAAEKLQEAPTIDAEPVRLRIDTVDVNTEKGWYRKLYYCHCGQLIRTETWDKKYCFGQGTVLKGNVMPKHCPNCGAKMDGETDGQTNM